MKMIHTSPRHLRYRVLTVLVLALSLTLSLALPRNGRASTLDFLEGPEDPASQPLVDFDLSGNGGDSIGCGSRSSNIVAASIDSSLPLETRLLFYSIPADQLVAGKNEVEIKAWVDGQVFLSEEFVIAKGTVDAIQERHRQQQRSQFEGLGTNLEMPSEGVSRVVFELLGDRPELRAELVLLGENPIHGLDIEVVVNGQGIAYQAFSEFTEDNAETVSLHGLPVVSRATAQAFPISTKPGSPQGFEICGDGVCAGGMPPFGENCESCPVDCGGACSICGNGYCGGTERCFNCEADCGVCQNCPKDLGTEARYQFLGSVVLGTSCRSNTWGTQLYDLLQNNYKQWTVDRTEACDGTITEIIVPGSTVFYSHFCYSPIGIYCPFPSGVASPTCTF